MCLLTFPELIVSSGLWLRDGVPVAVRGAGFGFAMGQHLHQPVREGQVFLLHLHPHDGA